MRNKLINSLNSTYSKLHSDYEKAFWDKYMGIVKDGKKMNAALEKRDAFRSDRKLKEKVEKAILASKGEEKRRLQVWNKFFSLYQTPDAAIPVRKQIALLEEKILKSHSGRKEGYIEPSTNTFVEASRNKMRTLMRTNPDEAVRKACFEALEKLPLDNIDTYIEVIKLRNQYANILGFEDFYAYKAKLDEGMTKDELFEVFDLIYEKTKYGFENIRKLEKEKPGLRKPWNFGYMMTGDFTKEEDKYYQFENVISLWGKSFSALGIGYRGGTLKLDLLDRKGKWDNGFCHYPEVVRYDKKGKFMPGYAGFTSNAIPSQVGSGVDGINTVFHEAGHAADRLNSIQKDSCLNTEYPPASVSWAETHSQFLDTISSSIEWKMRYVKDKEGNPYPFELFERKLKATYPLICLDMMHISFVMEFERRIYECKNLTKDFVIETAKDVNRKYFDRSEDSISILNVPHIYTWESSAYYHGYGIAELALNQWREYFFDKYGYIVDNPKVGKEMIKVWELGSLYTTREFVKIATKKELKPDAYIKNITRSMDEMLSVAKDRIKKLSKIPLYTKPVKLNAKIILVHGKQVIADNKKSFEDMEEKYRKWILKNK